MADLNDLERVVLMAFKVTGFFNKTPKRNVSRKSSGVWRSVQASGENMSLDEVAAGIDGLIKKELLRAEQSVMFLTDDGYEQILKSSNIR